MKQSSTKKKALLLSPCFVYGLPQFVSKFFFFFWSVESGIQIWIYNGDSSIRFQIYDLSYLDDIFIFFRTKIIFYVCKNLHVQNLTKKKLYKLLNLRNLIPSLSIKTIRFYYYFVLWLRTIHFLSKFNVK